MNGHGVKEITIYLLRGGEEGEGHENLEHNNKTIFRIITFQK